MTPDRLLLLMFQAWVRDINESPFPTIEAPEGQR